MKIVRKIKALLFPIILAIIILFIGACFAKTAVAIQMVYFSSVNETIETLEAGMF